MMLKAASYLAIMMLIQFQEKFEVSAYAYLPTFSCFFCVLVWRKRIGGMHYVSTLMPG